MSAVLLSPRVREDIWKCLKVGLSIATVYFGFVAVASALGGRQLAMFNGSLALAAGLYYGSAIVASIIVGVLLPLTRKAVGAYVVGVIAALPCVGILIFTLRASDPLALKLLGTGVMSLVASAVYTFALRD